MSVNSRHKATKIIGQRKAFIGREFQSLAKQGKKLLTNILVKSRNGEKKNHAIYQNNEQTSLKNKEVEPVELVQMNIYQKNTYREDLSWLDFGNELHRTNQGSNFLGGSFSNRDSVRAPIQFRREHQP